MSRMIAAYFFDGRSVQPIAVMLERDGTDNLIMRAPGLEQRFEMAKIEVTPRLGKLRRIMRLPDGGELHSDDNDAIDTWFVQQNALERLVDKLERNWPVVLGSMAVTVVALLGFYFYGLPVLAREIAHRLPPAIERKMGSEVMQLLESEGFSNSELPKPTQNHYQKLFTEFIKNYPDAKQFKLEMRDFGGPNAFALPGGYVIFTDDMIRMLQGAKIIESHSAGGDNDDENDDEDKQSYRAPNQSGQCDNPELENSDQFNPTRCKSELVSNFGLLKLLRHASPELMRAMQENMGKPGPDHSADIEADANANADADADINPNPAKSSEQDETEFEFEFARMQRNRDHVLSVAADEQFLAVLAHEIGHQRHHHVMRNVLQSSAVVVLSASVTGDVASVGALTSTIPVFLLQNHYSREFESEADEFAFVELKARKISPARFAEVMEKFNAVFGDDEETEGAGATLMRYASSHPPTPERIARARAAANERTSMTKTAGKVMLGADKE